MGDLQLLIDRMHPFPADLLNLLDNAPHGICARGRMFRAAERNPIEDVLELDEKLMDIRAAIQALANGRLHAAEKPLEILINLQMDAIIVPRYAYQVLSTLHGHKPTIRMPICNTCVQHQPALPAM